MLTWFNRPKQPEPENNTPRPAHLVGRMQSDLLDAYLHQAVNDLTTDFRARKAEGASRAELNDLNDAAAFLGACLMNFDNWIGRDEDQPEGYATVMAFDDCRPDEHDTDFSPAIGYVADQYMGNAMMTLAHSRLATAELGPLGR